MISSTSITLLALALAGATVHAAPAPKGIVVPLDKSPAHIARAAEPTVDLDWLVKTKARAAHKYRNVSVHMPGKRASSARESLTDQESESLWTGPITIGGHSFIVDWDTGSSDLWVPSSSCTSSGCSSHNKYTLSSTGSQQSGTFSISYGDGSTASGPVYKDTVTAAGLTVTNQVFSAVTSESASFSSNPADGISGLGFQALAQNPGTPYFETLIKQNAVSSPVFSFKLSKGSSELFLGGINSADYTGSLTYTPVTKQAYWTVALGGVSVGGSGVSISSTTAVIDTGTTLVYGSTSDVAAVYAAVPGSASLSSTLGSDYAGYYSFPCANVPSIALTFGGRSFTVPSSSLNLGQVSSGSSMCVGGIVGEDTGVGGWLVGDVFLQGVYAVFDVENTQVGFAQQA